ncbi:MAG: YgaP family membrane protein [Cecembia sp.]
MTKNMGTADKTVRIIIALIAAYLYFSGTIPGTWGIVLLVVAIVFVLTSLVSFCPLYTLIGINTCGVKKT